MPMRNSEKVQCSFLEPKEAGHVLTPAKLQTAIVNNTYMLWREAVKLRFLGQSIVVLLIILILVEIINTTC